MMAPNRVVALVPARNEEDRIAATVEGLRKLPLSEIVVVDDGSKDDTAALAASAGARVWRSPGRVGKGRALDEALDRIPGGDVYLFADGDLGETSSELGPVLNEVISGGADLCIAVLPPQEGGGFGLVKGLARDAIKRRTGFDSMEPLSGQRAIKASALGACRPFARGFGVETAMTIDALAAGLRVVEVETDVRHRPTGRGLRGFMHRARQGLDILLALAARKS